MADNTQVLDSKTEDKEAAKGSELELNNTTDPKDDEKTNGKSKEGENDDEEDESSEGEEHLGILDKPVVIEGKRARKSTEFLFTLATVKKEVKPLVFEGKGKSLGSIERVNYEITRSSAFELKPLHKFLYGREGRQSEVKKNIRNFNGFPFEKDSKQYESKLQAIERFTMEGLKRLCEIFDLGGKGKRDELMEKVLEFVMSPESSGRPAPTKPEKKKKKAPSKKKSAAKRKRTPAKGKKEVKEDKEEEDEDEEMEEESEGEEEEEEKVEPPKKKRKTEKSEKPKAKGKEKEKDKTKEKTKSSEKKKPAKKKEPVAVKITPLKKASPKKTPKKVKPSAPKDDSSDEEPLSKKEKKQPTNDELEKIVQNLLEDADLEQVTMKSVCKQVFDMFPNCDMTSRKDFIKETVRKVIS